MVLDRSWIGCDLWWGPDRHWWLQDKKQAIETPKRCYSFALLNSAYDATDKEDFGFAAINIEHGMSFVCS